MEIQKFTRVSQIRIGESVWSLRVMLLRVWVSMSSGADLKIRMILTDEEGSRIEATVYGDAYERFRFLPSFKGKWFRLSGAEVKRVAMGSSVTPHEYELLLNSETGFFPIYGDTPSGHFMIYPSFTEIFERKIDDAYPIGEIEHEWTGNKLQFTLRDAELRSIECLVYGQAAEDLITRFYMECDRHVFVILRCFYVVRWFGHTWLKGQEGMSTIKYDQYANPDWYSLVHRFLNPVPEEYPDGHEKRCIIF